MKRQLTPYQILGIPEDSDAPTIDAAYKRLMKRFHPDVNPDGAEVAKIVNQARDILADTEKRAALDGYLAQIRRPAPLWQFLYPMGSTGNSTTMSTSGVVFTFRR